MRSAVADWGTCCCSRMQGQAAPVWEMGWKSRVKGGEQGGDRVKGGASLKFNQRLSRRVNN